MAVITDVSPTIFNMAPSWQSVTGRMLAFSSSHDGNVAFIGSYANLWISKPAGTFRGERFVLADLGFAAGGWRVDRHPRLLADLRASGRADIVAFGDAGVYTALSNGDGTFAPVRYVIADFGYEANGWRVEKHPRTLADLRGNGRADIVGFADAGVFVALSNGDGTFGLPHGQPAFVLADFGYEAGGWRVEKHPRFLVDITGTHGADIVGFGDAGVYTALSNGDGTFGQPRFVLADFGYEAGGWRIEQHPRLLADLRGIGRADIIGFADAGVFTALSNGDGTFGEPRFVIPDFGLEAGGWQVDKHPRLLADLTGTGRSDIVAFGDAGVYTALSNGDGTFQEPRFVLPDFGFVTGEWRVDRHPRFLADVTGDGRADIVGFGDAGVWVALGNGDGTFQNPQFVVPDFGYVAGGWRVDRHPRFLADLTGDRRADIVAFGDAGVWTDLSNAAGEKWDQVVWPQPAPGQFDVPGSLGGWAVMDVSISAPIVRPPGQRGPRFTMLAMTKFDRESADRGIWRSTDEGNSWQRVHQFPAGETVGQFAWAPGSNQLVFAAGGSALAVSRDGGATFTDLTTLGRINHVAVGPPIPIVIERTVETDINIPPIFVRQPIVYALGNSTIFVSFDGGFNWTQDLGSIPPGIGAAVGDANSQAPSVLVVSPRTSLEVFVTANANGTPMLWRGDYSQFSTTHKSTWTTVPLPTLGDQDSGNVFLATTQPGRGDLLFYGAQRSKAHVGPIHPTSAADWNTLDAGNTVHVDLHGFFLSHDFAASLQNGNYQTTAGTVWLLSDGGINWSTDGGLHFQRVQNLKTLSCVNFAGVARQGLGPALSFNTGDNDGFYSLTGGVTWAPQDYGGGDNDCSFADPTVSNRMLVFTPRWDASGIINPASPTYGTVTLYKNDQGGLPDARAGTSQRHIVPGPTKLAPGDKWNAVSSYVLQGSRPIVLTIPGERAPGDGDYVFIRFEGARSQVLRTQRLLEIQSPSDWDTTATSASQGTRVFLQGPPLPSADLRLVQASGGHAATVIYVGGNSAHELWKWTAGMTQWQKLVPGGGATVARRFFAHPYQAKTIYILDQNNIKRSDDGGTTWHVDASLEQALSDGGRIPLNRNSESGVLIEVPLADMQFDPSVPLRRFAVGLAGAFVTENGVNWTRLLDSKAFSGLATNSYYDSVSDPPNRSLYVGFAGRSLVKISL
jgi:hypothetical protein